MEVDTLQPALVPSQALVTNPSEPSQVQSEPSRTLIIKAPVPNANTVRARERRARRRAEMGATRAERRENMQLLASQDWETHSYMAVRQEKRATQRQNKNQIRKQNQLLKELESLTITPRENAMTLDAPATEEKEVQPQPQPQPQLQQHISKYRQKLLNRQKQQEQQILQRQPEQQEEQNYQIDLQQNHQIQQQKRQLQQQRRQKQQQQKTEKGSKSWEERIANLGRWKSPDRALLFWAAVQLQFFHEHFHSGNHQTIDGLTQQILQLFQVAAASWDMFKISRNNGNLRKMANTFAPQVQLAHGQALVDVNAPPGNPKYAKERAEIAFVLVSRYAGNLIAKSRAMPDVLRWAHSMLYDIVVCTGSNFGEFKLARLMGFTGDLEEFMNAMAEKFPPLNIELSQQLALEQSDLTDHNTNASNGTNQPSKVHPPQIKKKNSKRNADSDDSSDSDSNDEGDDDDEDGGVTLTGVYDSASLDLQRYMANMSVQETQQEQSQQQPREQYHD